MYDTFIVTFTADENMLTIVDHWYNSMFAYADAKLVCDLCIKPRANITIDWWSNLWKWFLKTNKADLVDLTDRLSVVVSPLQLQVEYLRLYSQITVIHYQRDTHHG